MTATIILQDGTRLFIPAEISDWTGTVSAFAAELSAVQLAVAEARRHGGKKRKFSGASDLDEYFSPDKRHVCVGFQSPPSTGSLSEG